MSLIIKEWEEGLEKRMRWLPQYKKDLINILLAKFDSLSILEQVSIIRECPTLSLFIEKLSNLYNINIY